MFPLGKAVTSWALLLFALIAQFRIGKTSEGRVVCYYTNWSVYRPGTAKFNPQNINPYLCTHLIYAFGGFTKDNTLKTFDKYQDIEQGGYSKFNGLKTYNKELKTLLAIGGWNEGSTRFSSLVASPQRRQEFTRNIIKFLRQNHFDGLDLDWEYPSFRGGKSRDRENYAQFVQELREEFELESSKTGRPRLLLTMAVPAGIEYIKKGYDIKKLNKYLDWFNLLSYDYHSAFEPSVNHHAPLYSLEEESEYNYDTELNIDYSIKYYLNEGADRDKLVLGIPTYGRSYTLLNEDITDIGAPTDGPGAQGDATREKGYLSYYEICQNIMEDPDWTVVQPDGNKMGPYAYKDNQWVGYDDESIARKKGEYVVANGLGGIMFWSIDNDDFRGLCHKRPYPIIEAAKEAMLNGLGLGDNEVVGPSSSRRKPGRQRSRNTNKITTQTKDDEETISSKTETSRRQQNTRRRPSTTTERYEEVKKPVSRTTTPEPPTTPDPGADFKCEDEGFYPHPRDCKKYFWCLDSGPSNLGIVAHQFTCPSGLVFNKITDSCDYTRNVQCTTKTVATTTTARTTTYEPLTTSAKSRTTLAPIRSTFLKRPSTTADTRVIDEEEYIDEDEDDHKQLTGEEEEDPKVLKELIDIIKKLGGLEQLEKQLKLQENGSTLNKDVKIEQSPTAPTLISKSLYEKVLNSATGRNFLPNSRYTSTSTFNRNSSESSNSKTSNKYSSVIRNSRPGPQNSGIERQDESYIYQERPKYVTINRQSQSSANRNNEAIEEKNTEDEDSDDKSAAFVYTTSQPQYVNIQRTRPSTTQSSDDDTIDEDVESSTRRQYETLNRGKPFAVQNIDEESVTITTNRYKTIQRTRPSEATEQPELNDTPVFINQGQQLMVSENDPVITNTPDTTTRTYANFPRTTTETITEDYEQKTSPRTTTQITDKGFTDSTVAPESPTEVTEFVTVPSDVDFTIDNNQNEVTTVTNDLDTYSPTLINNSPNTPTKRPTSSLDISNDKTDQNKKVTTIGGSSSETQESLDAITNPPEFHGIVSSPRPFEFSKRTRRPAVRFSSSTVTTTSSTENTIVPVSNKVSSFANAASNPRRTVANLLLQRHENANLKHEQVSGMTTLADDLNDSQEINVDTTRYTDFSLSSASPNISPSSSTSNYDDGSHETFDSSFKPPNRFRTKSSNSDQSSVTRTTPRRQFVSTEASTDKLITQSRRVIPRRRLRPIEDDSELDGQIKQTPKAVIRPLRPTIETDLSSLTAGDFNKYSYVPKNTVRRIWPNRTTTASTTADYSNVDSNSFDGTGNAVRQSVRRRPLRTTTEANRVTENDDSRTNRISQASLRPLNRRKSLSSELSNREVFSQTSQPQDNTNSDSDSASNSHHFTISHDGFNDENTVVTTDIPVKLTLERKVNFASTNNRFNTEGNHRLNFNKYVSDSPIIYLNSRSTTRSPINRLHTEDAEQVSIRTDSSTLLNPLIYSVAFDNTNLDSTTPVEVIPSSTPTPNLRRPSYRSRNQSPELTETSTDGNIDDEIPRRVFKLKFDYGKHNEPDNRKSVEGLVVAESTNSTRSQSFRKPLFRTISKSSYSEFDEITEVSSVDSSVLSREEGQFETLTQGDVDEISATTVETNSINDEVRSVKEIVDNEIYSNTPVGLLNPLLAFNIYDTTLTPESTQTPDSTENSYDSTEPPDSNESITINDSFALRTESQNDEVSEAITTELPTVLSSKQSASQGLERFVPKIKNIPTYRGRINSQSETEEKVDDSKTQTFRRPTLRGRVSSTTESVTEINEEIDVTEATERRQTTRRTNRRPYQSRNEINTEQEAITRRSNRRPLHRSRIASTTESSIEGRNEAGNDDTQPIRPVIRRPALSSRTAVGSDEEDGTGIRVQVRRRRPIKVGDDESSKPVRNRIRRPNVRPSEGLDSLANDDNLSEEKQSNVRSRVRKPILRTALADTDKSNESTESPGNESLRSDSESIFLIRNSGRQAIAQYFDEISATEENVDSSTDTSDDLLRQNRVRLPSNTEIEDKIQARNEDSPNGVANRRRKVIRRLRPSSTTEQSLIDDVSKSDNEQTSVTPKRKVIRKLIRRPSTSEAPYHDVNGNIELLPVRGTFGPHEAEKFNSSEEDKEQVSHRRGKAKLFPDVGDDVENYYDNDVFSNDDKNNDTEIDEDEYDVNDEDYENQTNAKPITSTTQKSILNSRLFASRTPFRPTRPSIDTASSTTDSSSTSPKTYVRKYSSKFISPSQPPTEDSSDEVSLIGTVKPFVVHENLNRFRNSYKNEKEDDEDVHSDDEIDDEEDHPNRNVKLNYVPGGLRRPSNRPFSSQGIREDYEEEDQEVEPKFSSKPIPLRKQNRPYALKDAQTDTEVHDDKPSLQRPSPFNRPKYFNPTKKEENDVIPEVETETDDKPNSPYKPKPPRVRSSLPTTTTTKSSRKQNNPYTNKKFSNVNSETSSSNPLLDDLDRNALNSRNKKIFEKSSKKHLILNPSTQHQHELNDQTNTSNTSPSISENSEFYTEDYTHTMSTYDGGEYSTLSELQFDDTTQDNLLNTINFNEFQETTTEDQSVVFKIGKPTTTPKPTTLHHVFAIDYDEKTEMIPMPVDKEEKSSEVISQRVEKIAEVSRVVEIYSQQETHSNSGENKSSQSNLVLEKLPTVNKLGEISRITLIKLVDQNKDNNSLNEISKQTTKSHLDETKRHAKSIQKLISPETIFSVETSTIPLEALFQNERTSKVLSPTDETSDTSNGNSITTSSDIDKNQKNEIFTTDISPTKHVIQIEPLATPLVISLANLDKVVLSKLTNKSSSSAGNNSDIQSSGKVSTILAPQVVVASNETSKTDSTLVESIDPIVNTQTSYSSEISRVVKKSPKVYVEHGMDQPIIDGLDQPDAQPSKKIRPIFRPNFRRPTFTTKKINTTVSNEVVPTTESIVPTYQNNRRRRPTTTTTAISILTTTEANVKSSNKRKYSTRPNIDRRRYTPLSTSKTTPSTTTPTPAVTGTESPRTTNKFFRRRVNYFSTTTKQPSKNKNETESSTQDELDRLNDGDQKIEPSILDKKFTNNRYNQIGEQVKDDGLIEAITNISKAPLPVSVSSTTSRNFKNYSVYKGISATDDIDYNTEQPITRRIGVNFSTRRTISRRISTTSTTTSTTPQPKREYLQRRRPQPFERTQRLDFRSDVAEQVYNPIHHEYDYYDDSDIGIVAGHSHSKIKVILHDFGIIECLDQGNFPHPLSCRKFITCAKMEIGGVVGWEYTCPKELSFDPVGGMCNYSAGLGCKE